MLATREQDKTVGGEVPGGEEEAVVEFVEVVSQGEGDDEGAGGWEWSQNGRFEEGVQFAGGWGEASGFGLRSSQALGGTLCVQDYVSITGAYVLVHNYILTPHHHHRQLLYLRRPLQQPTINPRPQPPPSLITTLHHKHNLLDPTSSLPPQISEVRFGEKV